MTEILRNLKIVIPPRAVHFSTMIILASLPGKNSRLKALRQFSRRSLRCGVRAPLPEKSTMRVSGITIFNVRE